MKKFKFKAKYQRTVWFIFADGRYTGVYANDPRKGIKVAKELLDEGLIQEFWDSDDNYPVSFSFNGYDGRAQTEWQKICDKEGVWY